MGWLAGWKYRKAITVTNSVASALTDYPVAVDVGMLLAALSGKAKSDLSDLRVTDSDGVSLLSFYREGLGTDLTDFNQWSRHPDGVLIDNGAPGQWDSAWAIEGTALQVGSTYYIYYTGSTNDSNADGKIGFATSTDGIAWTKYASNPVLSAGSGWESGHVSAPAVLYEGGNWYMWYAGYDGTRFRIGYATSSDGISWTKYGGNPVMTVGAGGAWDSGFIGPTAVWHEGSTYYMVYNGGTTLADQSTWKLGLATSTDRVTWTKSSGNPFLSGETGLWDDGVLDMRGVLRIGSLYYAFYQGNTPDEQNSAHGLVTSPDLVTWTRDSSNPMQRGAAGDWDGAWTEAPALVRVGEAWHIYYMGYVGSGAGTKRMGVKRFKPPRLWVKLPTLGSSATTTIYVYYGNSAASDVSDGSSVFTFFEDFASLSAWTNPGSFTTGTDGGEAVLEKYAANSSAHYTIYTTATFAPPFIVECRAKVGSDWAAEWSGQYQLELTTTGGVLYTDPSFTGVTLGHWKDNTTDEWIYDRVVAGSNSHQVLDSRPIVGNCWTDLAIRIPSSGTIVAQYNDGRRSQSIAASAPATPLHVQLRTARASGNSDYTTLFDKVWVRPYADSDPSVTVGVEQMAGDKPGGVMWGNYAAL